MFIQYIYHQNEERVNVFLRNISPIYNPGSITRVPNCTIDRKKITFLPATFDFELNLIVLFLVTQCISTFNACNGFVLF